MQTTKFSWKSLFPPFFYLTATFTFNLSKHFFGKYFRGFFCLAFILFQAPAVKCQTLQLADANKPQNGISPAEIKYGQKNIVLYGFGITVSGPLTITDFNIGISSAENKNYFGNLRLYKSADSISSPDDVLINSTATFKKTNLNIGLSETYSNTAAISVYYFLVADYTNPIAAVPGSVQFNFMNGQKADAIIHDRGAFNNFNISGNNFIISPPGFSLSNENAVTNGISPALITFNQKNIVLFGFGVKVDGISTISDFNMTSTNSIGSYFTNGKLYRSADSAFSPDDLLISSVTINKSIKNDLSFPNLNESFDASPVRYYFFVADYTTNGPVLNNTIQFRFINGQATAAVSQSAPQSYSYNTFDIPGQVFVFAKTADWLGNDIVDPSSWNNAANWSGRFVPGSTDIANVGIQTFVNQPRVSTTTTVGSINLGTGQSVILTVDSAVTLNAGDVIQKAADVSIVNTITGMGTFAVNNLHLTELGSVPAFTAPRTSRIVSSISNLMANSLIIRSAMNGYKNDASFEVAAGAASIAGVIQTINTTGSNTSAFIAGDQSVVALKAPVPFNRSSAGSTAISLTGTVIYNGTTDQIVETFAGYNHLFLEGSGVKTVNTSTAGPFNLGGKLSITSPATIAYASAITALNIRGNFEGNASLRSASLPVSIGGNWTNSVKEAITGDVSYNGTDQQVGGLHYTNVTFLNGGLKQLADSAIVKGNLHVGPNTVLNTTGKLKLAADSAGTAAIGPLLNGADVIGDVTVQAFVKGGKRGYLTLSSPVYDLAGSSPESNSFSYSQLKNTMPVTGPYGPANGFDQGAIINPYGATIRLFREEAAPAQAQYYNAGSLTETISAGRGFNFYFRGNRSNIYYKVNQPYITPENVLIEYRGSINKGNLEIPLSYTYYADANDNGFNLLGNPYPAVIDLQKLLSANALSQAWILKIDNTYAVYDANLETGTNGASRYLIPGQGFFVMAGQQGQALTFTEDIKVAVNSSPRIMMEESRILSRSATTPRQTPLIKLTVRKDGTDLSDETILVFKNGSTANRSAEDAKYLGEGKILLGTRSSDDHLLSINYLPPGEADTEIRLQVNGEDTGNYSFYFSDHSVSGFSEVLLQDLHLNKIVSLYRQPSYAFRIDKAVPGSFGSERFKIIIKGSTAVSQETQKAVAAFSPENIASQSGFILYPNPADSQLRIALHNKTGPVELRIFNMAGAPIKTTVVNYSEIISHPVGELAPGAYVLHVRDARSRAQIGNGKFIKK